MGFIIKEKLGKLQKEAVSLVRGWGLFYAIVINLANIAGISTT
jgi:hypothetical protein